MQIIEMKDLIKEAKKVRNGTYTRIGYRSELPVKAELKKQRYVVYKYTEMTVRLGVNYGKMSSVIARKELEAPRSTSRVNNFEWVIKNKVRFNSNTNKHYMYVADVGKTGQHTKSMYILETKEGSEIVSKDKLADILIPSYFNRTTLDRSEMKNISFENIYLFNHLGQSMHIV